MTRAKRQRDNRGPRKSVYEAIAMAEAVLPGQAAPEGEVDPRWQAIIAVGKFIETEPEAVWSFIDQWGGHRDEDLRMAIATCLLEHLLEHHFDAFIARVEDRARGDALFASTVRSSWTFGQAADPDRAARLDRLIAAVGKNV
jgi:hypothetical protein